MTNVERIRDYADWLHRVRLVLPHEAQRLRVIANDVDDEIETLRALCRRLVCAVRVAESESGMDLINARFADELRAAGVEVDE